MAVGEGTMASTSGGVWETDLRRFQKRGLHFSGQEMIVYASKRIPRQQGGTENMGEGGGVSDVLPVHLG